MDKGNRTELEKAINMIDEAKSIIDWIGEGEQEKFDNLTEGLQAGERGQKFEENATTLADIADTLHSAIDEIWGVMRS